MTTTTNLKWLFDAVMGAAVLYIIGCVVYIIKDHNRVIPVYQITLMETGQVFYTNQGEAGVENFMVNLHSDMNGRPYHTTIKLMHTVKRRYLREPNNHHHHRFRV